MKNFPLAILTLPVRGTDNMKLGQLYACCCPAFQHHQVISSHNINSLWADCFKEIWLCICISYHSSTLKWHIYLKSFHRDAMACLCEIIMALVLGWGWGWGWVSSSALNLQPWPIRSQIGCFDISLWFQVAHSHFQVVQLKIKSNWASGRLDVSCTGVVVVVVVLFPTEYNNTMQCAWVT